MSDFKILAPLSGWCSLLDDVPDPVFAGRMLGDGMAIDPTVGRVVAPCAGEIITLPDSAHAVSLRTPQGIDVLMHVGIDTVTLNGAGFEALVRPGARVQAGDELLVFDLEVVARGAKSLITPVVIGANEALSLLKRRAAGPVAAGELLYEVHIANSAGSAADAVSGDTPISRRLPVPLRHGLHARPAALIAQRAKSFDARITLTVRDKKVDARSLVGIMSLGARHEDTLIVEARGGDAERAIAGIAEALQNALRLEAEHVVAGVAVQQPASAPQAVPVCAPPPAGEFAGVTAVAGFAVGRATRIERRAIDVREAGSTPAQESAELNRARADVRLRLQRLATAGGHTRREIVAAHLEFLDDPALNDMAGQSIAAGKSAGFAWRDAVRRVIATLQALDDVRLRERVDDLKDIEGHVLLALAGEARPMLLPLPEDAIVLADDLLPSEFSALDGRRLRALCLSAGGATSHVAILAAAMEIPTLVGLGAGLRDVVEGATVIVDADKGRLKTRVSDEEATEARAAIAVRRARHAAWREAARSDCRTMDGTRVEVFANVGSVQDALAAVQNGAEGCGLLRTEFLFIERDSAPSEAEQLTAYQAIADALAGRPLILRLMDVGGDKPLKYLPLPHEDNPALGLRGIRTALANPELLLTQLRAALRVAPAGRIRLLLPMITEVSEIRAVRQYIEQIIAQFPAHGSVQIGAMIETPAAALTARALSGEVDFFSIGSNDLTQYTLAMDRGHPQLTGRADALHPAVLRLVALAAEAAAEAGKLMAVCGSIAADPCAAPVLLGLGVRELSVVPGAIPMLKRRLGSLRIADCRDAALRCIELDSATRVRDLIATRFDMGDRR